MTRPVAKPSSPAAPLTSGVAPSPWTPFESRRRARDEKRHAILRLALSMFLEEGYHRTTMNEIARRLNITKPALYNYFAGKEDIVVECYRVGIDMFDSIVAAKTVIGSSGLERLRTAIRAYAHMMTVEFGMCVVRVDDRDLSQDTRTLVAQAKAGPDATFRGLIADGIADGSISPRDIKLTGMIIIGALNAIGQWYRPGGKNTADEIADEFALRLTEGMAMEKRQPEP